jgi:hypothetical protein
MKRILKLSSGFAVVLAFGLTGCDSGGGPGAGEGVPTDAPKAVPTTTASGQPLATTDMTQFGNKAGAKKAAPKEGDDAKATPAPAK